MINEIRLWLGKPKALFFTLPMLLLLFTVACGSAAAPETVVVETEVVREVPVDREVVREVPIDREVVREVVKEVPVDREVVREVPVDREVVREVPVDREVVREVPVDREVVREVPVDREVVREVPVDREVVREVPVDREVVREVPVDREVVREVPVDRIVVVTPVIATAPKNVIPVGTLNVAMAGLGPFTRHPMLASGTATDVLSTAVAEALWQYDIDRRAIPMLVKSWSISDDFTTWTLNLQEGVQFHKGYGEFTAEDVSWSLGQRILNPKATNVAQLKWAWQTSVDMPDAYTMVVNTGDPMPGWAFVDLVRNPGDQYVVSKKQTEEIGAEAANRNIAATGPWRSQSTAPGNFGGCGR